MSERESLRTFVPRQPSEEALARGCAFGRCGETPDYQGWFPGDKRASPYCYRHAQVLAAVHAPGFRATPLQARDE